MGSSARSVRSARTFVLMLIIAAFSATNASAAVLVNVEGSVFVKRNAAFQLAWGDGFQSASSGTALSSGDWVRTSASGSAQILYENGCSTRVEPSEIAVVLTMPPSCHGATLPERK